MEIVRHYDEDDLKELIKRAVLAETGMVVKTVTFKVSQACNAYDQHAGIQVVRCEVEVLEGTK